MSSPEVMASHLELNGSRILLTGATGGLGLVIARALAARGAHLILSGRRIDVLEDLREEIGATSLAADLADRAGIAALLEAAGDIDVLIANAALPSSGDPRDYTEDEIGRALLVNLEAPILMARAAALQMVPRGRGQIVLVGSMAGIAASTNSALYNATKFGLRGFALAFRQDLRGTGVGVTIVEPGFVRGAGMFADADVSLPKGVRTVSPDEVAAGVIDAIENNRGEKVIAPPEMRVGAAVGSLFPELAAAVQRRVAGEAIGHELAEGQRSKR